MDIPRFPTEDIQNIIDYALYTAAAGGELDEVNEYLLLNADLANFADNELCSKDAVIANVLNGSCDVAILKAIYNAGHDVNQRCSEGKTALDHVQEIIASCANKEVLKQLNRANSFLRAVCFNFPRNIDHTVYYSIILTCKAWSGSATYSPKSPREDSPYIFMIPSECLELIFTFACNQDWKQVLEYQKQRISKDHPLQPPTS